MPGRRLSSRVRHVGGFFHELHFVYVTGAVGKDGFNLDAHDLLGPRIAGHERIITSALGGAKDAHPCLLLKIDEQQPDLGCLVDVPHGEMHAVPVVIGEGKGLLVNDRDRSLWRRPCRSLLTPLAQRIAKENLKNASGKTGGIFLSSGRNGPFPLKDCKIR